MNWEAMGAIGEVVGALGVIVSLVYLALQIRQNSNVVRAATRQAISTTQVDIGLRVAESPDLLASIAEWWGSDDATTPLKDHEIRGNLLRRAFLRAYENQYHQYKDGTFDAGIWNGYRESMKHAILSPKGRESWELSRGTHSSEFVRFVDREIIGSSDTGKSGSDSPPK